MSPFFRLLSFTILAAIVFSACNVPGGNATPTPGPEAIFTKAAQTVQAQLTETAPQATSTPPAITPAATETPPPPLATATLPPIAVATATPGVRVTPTPRCDEARFVSDVTIPDGTEFLPGATFRKTWRLRNTGSCTWTSGYAIVFDSGNAMGAPASVSIPGNVPPGSTVDVSVNFVAPPSPGDYTSNWKLRNSAGVTFGLGATGANPFWLKIKVRALAPGIGYDFVASYCSAQWLGGTTTTSETLPCPGKDTDSRGFVIRIDEPKFETGSTDDEPALYTHPRWVDNGIVAGKYPAFTVQTGDRFQTVIGCLYREGGSACNVRFQLNYIEAGSSTPQPLGEWVQTYDDSTQSIDVPLDALAGKSVQFVLVVMANGPSTQDMAFWLYPRIKR